MTVAFTVIKCLLSLIDRWSWRDSSIMPPAIMGLQQQMKSRDFVDYPNHIQQHRHRIHNDSTIGQEDPISPQNTSFTSTKGLLNGPGQNNCFLNSAVQVRIFSIFIQLMSSQWLGYKVFTFDVSSWVKLRIGLQHLEQKKNISNASLTIPSTSGFTAMTDRDRFLRLKVIDTLG